MRTLGQFVALLFLIGVVGAYGWLVAITIAAATISYHVTFRHVMRGDDDKP